MRRFGKIIIYILLGGITFIGLLVAAIMWATAGLPDAAQKFSKQVSTANLEALYDDFSAELRAEVRQEDVRQLLQTLTVLGQSADFVVQQRSNRSGTATVAGLWTTEAQAQFHVTLQYFWRDGAWTMTGFHFAPLTAFEVPTDQDALLGGDSDYRLHRGQIGIG